MHINKIINITFTGLLIIFLMFLSGCKKSKLQSNWWKLVGVNNPEQVQAYTDTLLMQEIRDASPEAVKHGYAFRVKDSTWFHKSRPVDFSQFEFSLGFFSSGVLKVKHGNSVEERKYELSWNKLTMNIGTFYREFAITCPLSANVSSGYYKESFEHGETIHEYVNGTTDFSFRGRDTLILNNMYSNSLIFIKGDPIK